MSQHYMPNRTPQRKSGTGQATGGWLAVIAVVLAMLIAIGFSVSVLPAAPLGPTPTWAEGINLPDKLPRISR